jgi:DNA topoisomerase-2
MPLSVKIKGAPKSTKVAVKKKPTTSVKISPSSRQPLRSKTSSPMEYIEAIIFEGVYDNLDDVFPMKALFHDRIDAGGRKQRNVRSASDYKQKSQREQIYARPETYIGQVEFDERQEDVLDLETDTFIPKEVSVPRSVIHLFMEMITNVADNYDATRRADASKLPKGMAKKLKNIGRLETWIDNRRITVRNAGLPIPVIPSQEIGELVPIIIFGRLNTGSSYDDAEFIRTGSGRNGLGGKACNIFSTFFSVKIGDPINGQEVHIIWTGNMSECSYMKCTPGYERDGLSYARDEDGNFIAKKGKKYKGDPYVEVEYELDFERFDCDEYPEETLGVLAQRVLFLGMSSKILVSINDREYDVRNIRDFAKLRFSEETCKTAIVHYEWPTTGRGKAKTSVIPARFAKMKPHQIEKAIINPESSDEIPMIELLALDTSDDGFVLSSVNGQCTPEHGVHVLESFHAVSDKIVEEINETLSKSKQRQKKPKKGEKEVKMPKITMETVKKHISMVVNARLMDTTYTSQTKVKLSKPKPKIEISKKGLEPVKKWNLTFRLIEEMDSKLGRAMKKKDGKKSRFITPKKGEDANEAGGPKSDQCTLYWCEGDSATAYPKKRISYTPGGKDFGGYFPGKGKMINICKASAAQLINNEDLNRLKHFTGIFEGIDVGIPADRKKMRYGFICITTDADKDGQHILMLRLNCIYRRYPSLIEYGMVGYIKTPFARALKGVGEREKVLETFLDETDLNKWLDDNTDWFIPKKNGHSIKYYKGLAGSSDENIRSDMDTAPMVVVFYDENSENSLDIAFRPENADKRKIWIAKWREATGLHDIALRPIPDLNNWYERDITDLCNENLVEYSLETYIRALPCQNDGLKESQRKSLYGGLLRWNFGDSTKGELNVGKLANNSAEVTGYHYNVTCLENTLARQAHNFTGSNNMAYFKPTSQLGSRHQGGADAGQARYTFLRIAPWIKHVYSKEFIKAVKMKFSEGSEVEPEWLPAVIPMHLINGGKGIATAYSTFLPNHNPYDIIDWLIERCNGKKNPKHVEPWYREFNGKLETSNVDWKKTRKVHDDGLSDEESGGESESESDDEEKVVDELDQVRKVNKVTKGGPNMRSYGVFEQVGSKVVITDLPIGTWTYNYRKYLEKLREEGNITKLTDNSLVETVKFTIEGFQGKATHKKLRLIKRDGLSNMVLTDIRGYPIKYKNTQEILQVYYKKMIEMFTNLKDIQIGEIKDRIHDIDQRLLFIISHNDGKLVIQKKTDEEVFAQMDSLGIEHKYYDLIKVRELSMKKIEELEGKLFKAEEELEARCAKTVQDTWLDYLYNLETQLKKLKICIRSKLSIQNQNMKIIEDDEPEKPKKKVSVKVTPRPKGRVMRVQRKVATKKKPVRQVRIRNISPK